MSNYVVTVNSTVDLPKAWLEERNVPVVPLKYTIEDKTYVDMEGLSSKEFFGKLREGKMAITSQVNPDEARELLEPILKEGKDILHLGFSSGLSGTYNSMRLAAEELKEDYPIIYRFENEADDYRTNIENHTILKSSLDGDFFVKMIIAVKPILDKMGVKITREQILELIFNSEYHAELAEELKNAGYKLEQRGSERVSKPVELGE